MDMSPPHRQQMQENKREKVEKRKKEADIYIELYNRVRLEHWNDTLDLIQ